MSLPFKKSFVIPIYGVQTRLVVADEIIDLILQIAKDEKREDHKDTRAWTHIDWPKAYLLFRSDSLNFNSIGHEVDHLTHWVMRNIGVKETDESDEAFAYMQGWLNDKVMAILGREFTFLLRGPKKRNSPKKRPNKKHP